MEEYRDWIPLFYEDWAKFGLTRTDWNESITEAWLEIAYEALPEEEADLFLDLHINPHINNLVDQGKYAHGPFIPSWQDLD